LKADERGGLLEKVFLSPITVLLLTTGWGCVVGDIATHHALGVLLVTQVVGQIAEAEAVRLSL
jgi:hypothetical protein